MSKYFNESIISIKNYRENMVNKPQLTNEEIIKRTKVIMEKQNIVTEKLAEIFDQSALISTDAVKLLCGIYDLKDMKKPKFDKDLINAYQLTMMYPNLNKVAIKEILPYYDGIFFEEYNYFDELESIVNKKDDNELEKFISKLIVTRLNYDDTWKKEASILDIYKDVYGNKYIDYLKSIIIEERIDASSILLSMPSAALIKKDENLVNQINVVYGTNKIPFSYKITYKYAVDGNVDNYSNALVYITGEDIVVAPFTLEEYLSDIKRINTI